MKMLNLKKKMEKHVFDSGRLSSGSITQKISSQALGNPHPRNLKKYPEIFDFNEDFLKLRERFSA
tara:strand:- start:1102 stop:1296 length:195 start_codon:yes stop_codon:yes gene_type:complete